MAERWGFIRETSELALKAGKDKETGLYRTGLNEYLAVIFSETSDWVHDKVIQGSGLRTRPDYRSESLKLIVEFDGMQHYQKPDVIHRDAENTKRYDELGYKVVRIPYFIQLSNSAVEKMFGVNVEEKLFDEKYPSLGIDNGPGYLCYQGILRMAKEFKEFPSQYKVNIENLRKYDDFFTGVGFLEKAYNSL